MENNVSELEKKLLETEKKNSQLQQMVMNQELELYNLRYYKT